MSTAINFGKVRIYNQELPSIKSHDHLIRWSGDFDLSYTICRFRMQRPKSSPTDCSRCSCSSLQPFGVLRNSEEKMILQTNKQLIQFIVICRHKKKFFWSILLLTKSQQREIPYRLLDKCSHLFICISLQ